MGKIMLGGHETRVDENEEASGAPTTGPDQKGARWTHEAETLHRAGVS